jgi:hypothetical protein
VQVGHLAHCLGTAPFSKGLTTLHASFDLGSPEALAPLTSALGSGAVPSLTDLDLSPTLLRGVGAALLANALTEPLGPGKGLKRLCLKGAVMGRAGTVHLARALGGLVRGRGGCPVLTSLDLSGNCMGDEGMAAVAAAISAPPPGGLPSLAELILADNRASAEGAGALAMALAKGGCPALTHLSLAGNVLGREAPALMAVLEGLPLMRVLALQNTGMGVAGVRALVVAGTGRHSLKHLTSLRVSKGRGGEGYIG